MKKVLITVAIIVVFAAYTIYQHNQSANKNTATALGITVNPAPVSDTPPRDTPSTTPTVPVKTPTTPPNHTPTTTPAVPPSSGQFKNDEYTGDVADAFYGKIQVKVVITDGKLADVQFLQYPNERGETTQISNRSLPILKSEAIKAQSATVDVVSGATQTSEGFMNTLKSALSQAM